MDAVLWHQPVRLPAQLPVEPGRQAEGRQHTQIAESGEALGVALLGAQPQLGGDATPGDRSQGPRRERPADQLERLGLDLEAQPRRVAGQAQQAGRVVDEASLVQHPQPPRAQIIEGVLRRDQPAPVLAAQWQGDRVDREVPPRQVLLDGAGTDLRQRARGRVGLGTQLGDVDPAVDPGDRRRAEALVDRRLQRLPVGPVTHREGRRQRRRELGGAAGDGHVELPRRAPQQQVAHGAADQRDVRALSRERQQLGTPGEPSQLLDRLRAPRIVRASPIAPAPLRPRAPGSPPPPGAPWPRRS